jgi:Ankyrin repeats (3 copies)
MPVRSLPSNPNLNHLKYQAKDLLKGHATRILDVAQRIREFHPNFTTAPDAEIFSASFSLSSAQLTIAREHGFRSWARLKQHVEKPAPSDSLHLPHHERIANSLVRHAVDLLDAGDTAGLRAHLKHHPDLVRQHVAFEGGNYFRNPSLLEFVAENPIRHGTLPENIVAVTEVILEAGAERSSLNDALGLICSGRVPRECRVQLPLIDLLCDHAADPNMAIEAAAVHGEFEAVNALIRRGAQTNLPVAAALGNTEAVLSLLPGAGNADRHRAFALASQFGHVEIVRSLLDAGEDPNRYNPVGFHSHSTPIHQAALAGHDKLVRLLVERGARVDLKDVLWHGTPADWAEHAGKTEVGVYLRGQEKGKEEE